MAPVGRYKTNNLNLQETDLCSEQSKSDTTLRNGGGIPSNRESLSLRWPGEGGMDPMRSMPGCAQFRFCGFGLLSPFHLNFRDPLCWDGKHVLRAGLRGSGLANKNW